MIIKILTEFGLSEKESQVYVTLLELELAGVNDISKKAGINRSSTYVVIESLMKKGLVSMTPDKKIQQYVATTPELLLRIAQKNNEKSAAIKEKIEKLLPELRALHKETVHKPKVVVYEGDEALKMSYYSTFDSSEFRIYKDLSGMLESVPKDYIEKDAEKRLANGVKMFLIAPKSKENLEIAKRYKKSNSIDEFSFVPPSKFSKSGNNIGIGIYNDRIKFSSSKDKFSIFIIDKAIADTLKDLFDLAWKNTKEFKN